MGINDLISIARTAMLTHQRALDITGHNIANANTPGYSRQRLELAAAVPLRTPIGTIGRGVTATAIMSYRDVLLDAAFRREQGGFSHADTLRSTLLRIEDLLDEATGHGIGAALDGFFGAFSQLADTPFSGPARIGVRDAARHLAQLLNTADQRLATEQAAIGAQMADAVVRINSIATRVAELNRQIVAASAGTGTAPDLQDARDALLDELSGLVGTRVIPRSDGTVAVITGDVLLVDGAFAQQLEVRATGAGWGAGIVGSPRDMAPGAGVMRALVELSAQGIPAVRGELDRLARELVTAVNALHAAGTTPGGVTGVDFFDAAGLTAGTIRLSAAVAADPLAIVAGATSASGDNTVALQLAALRTTAIPGLNGLAPGDFHLGLIAQLGGLVRDADQSARIAETLVTGIVARREAVRGVSTDEEMVNLMVQQQAFAAATRLVAVADELMQDILRMV